MRRIRIAFVIILLLLVPFPIVSAQGTFTDIQGHWAEEAIDGLRQRELLAGYEDGSFRPDRSVTRAEFVTVTVRTLGNDDVENVRDTFYDVPEHHWAASSIAAAKRQQLITGYPNSSFRPEAPITRAEAAAIFDRVFLVDATKPAVDFPDVPQSHWARSAIMSLTAKGIVVGDEQGFFYPNRSLSRAELAAMLWRVLGEATDPGEGHRAYTLELERWGVYNDGTHSAETTKGINDALVWAKANGYTMFKVPEGTYVIAKGTKAADPQARINMVGDMVLDLHENAVLVKETNPWEVYDLIYVGGDAENVVIRGGTLRGDRDSHDYSQRGTNTAGTHEWGYGIQIAGAEHVTIENMKIEKFTGDGIAIGGLTVTGSYITEQYLEPGGLNARGEPIAAEGKIRTVGRTQTNFDHPAYDTHRSLHMWLPQGLTSDFYDICFYRADGSMISCDADRKIYSVGSVIPEGADYFRAVFDADGTKGVRVNRMTIDNARDVSIRNNDIGFNRRQGITAGGEDVRILNNKIHNTGGVAPQAGIDIEPGFFPAIGHLIQGNEFYNNKLQIVLAYGEDVTIEDNVFIQENISGALGLYIHEAYRGATVNGNRFQGSSLTLRSDGTTADGNEFMNTSINLLGDRIQFKDAVLTDTSLSVGEGTGTTVENVTIANTGADSRMKGSLSVWGKPVTIRNVAFRGVPVSGMIGGTGSKEALFENVIMEETGAFNLPSGTYVGCSFASSAATTVALQVTYPDTDMQECSFSNVTLRTNSATNTLTVKDSTFTYTGDLAAPAVYAIATADIALEGNSFYADHLKVVSHPIVKLGRYAWTNREAQVMGGAVVGNVIRANIRVSGVHTTEAGVGAPPYTVTDNVLYNATLVLKPSDIRENNIIQN